MGVNWVTHYEALRAHALGEAPVTFVPLGLGVLYHRGVAAWMRCEALARSDPSQTPVRTGPHRRSEIDLSPLQSELVRLLVGAALRSITTRSA
jgi:hypothetical protein